MYAPLLAVLIQLLVIAVGGYASVRSIVWLLRSHPKSEGKAVWTANGTNFFVGAFAAEVGLMGFMLKEEFRFDPLLWAVVAAFFLALADWVKYINMFSLPKSDSAPRWQFHVRYLASSACVIVFVLLMITTR